MQLVVGSLTRLFGEGGAAARKRIAAGVQRWRKDLNEALRHHLAAPLQWDEDQEEGWSMVLPDVAHRALQLLAAYAQKTDLRWPDRVPPRVDMDPAFQEISAGDFARCHYPQVVIPGFWVPGDFALTMKHALPDGEEVVLGSLDGLVMQLKVLNNNTLCLTAEAAADHVRGNRKEIIAEDDDFLAQAARGLTALSKAAHSAKGLGVPVRLLQIA